MTQPGQFAHTYHAQLLCKARPNVRKRALLAALVRRCPGVEPMDGDPDSGLLLFIHPGHPVTFREGTLPAQTLFVETEAPANRGTYEPALQQSWQFPAARQRVGECAAALL